jgi:hypothetical protein
VAGVLVSDSPAVTRFMFSLLDDPDPLHPAIVTLRRLP